MERWLDHLNSISSFSMDRINWALIYISQFNGGKLKVIFWYDFIWVTNGKSLCGCQRPLGISIFYHYNFCDQIEKIRQCFNWRTKSSPSLWIHDKLGIFIYELWVWMDNRSQNKYKEIHTLQFHWRLLFDSTNEFRPQPKNKKLFEEQNSEFIYEKSNHFEVTQCAVISLFWFRFCGYLWTQYACAMCIVHVYSCPCWRKQKTKKKFSKNFSVAKERFARWWKLCVSNLHKMVKYMLLF